MSAIIIQGTNSVARTFDGGTNWQWVNTFPSGVSTVTLNDIVYIGNNCWNVGGKYSNGSGFVMWSDDNGGSWNKSNLALSVVPDYLCQGTTANQVTLFDKNNSVIVYSSDYGKNWTVSANAFPIAVYSGIYHSGKFMSGNGYSIGFGYKFYSIFYYQQLAYSTNPTTTNYVQVNNSWVNNQSSVYINGFYGNGNYVVISDSANGIAYTANPASSWTKKTISYASRGAGVFSNDTYIIMSLNCSITETTTNVAGTWSGHSTGLSGNVGRLLYDSSSGKTYASDTSVYKLYTSSDGASWSTITIPSGNTQFHWESGNFDINPVAGLSMFFTHSII